MSTITFDTQELVSELRSSGIPQEQAEAVVRVIVKSHEDLSTKSDIERLDIKLSSKIDLLRAENTHTRWMLGILVALAIADFAKQFF